MINEIAQNIALSSQKIAYQDHKDWHIEMKSSDKKSNRSSIRRHSARVPTIKKTDIPNN
jgi:hypothetical protein